MDFTWIDDLATTKKGAECIYKAEWGAQRYLIKDKMFGMRGTHKDGRPIVTLKLEPLHGELMRKQYKDTIIPGYYMNKVHWNSVYLDTDIPKEVIENMMEESYQLTYKTLPVKVQKEINTAE